MLPCSQSRPCIFCFLFCFPVSYYFIIQYYTCASKKNFCSVIFLSLLSIHYLSDTPYMRSTAVTASVIQNACQTPAAPNILLKINANGKITAMYLSTEITNDSFPFPSPSNAPDTVTETDDAINPMLIRRSASFQIVSSPDYW